MMKAVITPRPLSGELSAIESKSHVHRLLICASLGNRQNAYLPCRVISGDIGATVRCLNTLGADIKLSDSGFAICPVEKNIGQPLAALDCGESGSTYRFLVPVAAALGKNAEFRLFGRLPGRPMDELWRVLENHGVSVEGKGGTNVKIRGKLTPGKFVVSGGVSSQFISGLLLALPMLDGDSELIVTGEVQSAGYIELTLSVLREFSVKIIGTRTGFIIPGGQKYVTPHELIPEADWSNAAVWLSAGAMRGSGITITGLKTGTVQGDSEVCEILKRFGAGVSIHENHVTVKPGILHGITIDAGNIPDLIPPLSAVAAAAEGVTVINNAGRLRLKESDRISAVCETVNSLGGHAEASGDTIIITGSGSLEGGAASSFGDHRIAMTAAVASVICRRQIEIYGAEATGKSYPMFFDDFAALGGEVLITTGG